MPKITSNGGNTKGYHQCALSGDLPMNQGTPDTQEIRVVRLTGNGGHLGSYDFCSLQYVQFDGDGRPIHIQDYEIGPGTADTILLVANTQDADLKDAKTIRQQLTQALVATDKSIIDLTS